VLPLLLALTEARRRGVPLSRLAADLPQRHSFSGRLQGIDAGACRTLLAAAEASGAGLEDLFGAAPAALDRTDGLRATFGNGDILHVRMSGNAPELRCYAEAGAAEQAERLCGEGLARLSRLLSGRSAST